MEEDTWLEREVPQSLHRAMPSFTSTWQFGQRWVITVAIELLQAVELVAS